MKNIKPIQLLLVVIGLFANIFLSSAFSNERLIIAHRGVHQTYHKENLDNQTCTATRIDQPTHNYLENTILSIRSAFEYGADIVEIDIHPTRDKHFVVFHDWTIDCRTEGSGVTREQTLAYLKSLDIGYGYTADQGKTFPFRDKGVGLMPTLKEVLDEFPNRQFLINFKSRDIQESELFNSFISQYPKQQRQLMSVYGGTEEMLLTVSLAYPEINAWPSKSTIKKCFITLALSASYGMAFCDNKTFALPLNYAEKLMGWPERVLETITENNSQLFVAGIDSFEVLNRVINYKSIAIWTDKIEVIGPMLKQ